MMMCHSIIVESVDYANLCSRTLSADDIARLKHAISNVFYYSMFVGMSSIQHTHTPSTDRSLMVGIDGLPMHGFVGVVDPYEVDAQGRTVDGHFLFTHLHFTFLYNDNNVIYANISADAAHIVNLDQLSMCAVQQVCSQHWH
jgi:hypothetical protein